MNDVVIAGVGIHPFGRFEDRTITDMGVTAVRAALAEAGVGPGGFQAAFCATAYGGVASGHKVLSRLGMTGMPIVDVEAGCASGGAALMLGAGAIRAGAYDTVLVFGVEKMPKGMIRSSFFEPWQEDVGARRHARLLRPAGPTSHAGLGGHQGPSGRGGGEEPPPRGAQPRRHVPHPRSTPPPCWRRAWCAIRCTSGCCARPTKEPPPWC